MADHTLTVDVPSPLYERLKQSAYASQRSLEEVALKLLTADESSELESLHLKRQREGLSPIGEQRAVELENLFERFVFQRSHAAMLLKERERDYVV